MKQTSEQATGRKKPAQRAGPKVLILSCRRTLRQRPGLDLEDTWADRINFNLYGLACDKNAPVNVRLQAIRTVIDLCNSEPAHVAKPRFHDSESKSGTDSLRPTPEEEALSDEELDAEIAELQACLDSVPESGS